MLIKKLKKVKELPWPPQTNARHRLGAFLALEAGGSSSLILTFDQAEIIGLGTKIGERDLDPADRPAWVKPELAFIQLPPAHWATWFIWSAVKRFPFFKSRFNLGGQFLTSPTDEDERGGLCSLVITWSEPVKDPNADRSSLVMRHG